MQYISVDKQKVIDTDTCWLLREVLSQEDIPYGIAYSQDIKPTKMHRNIKSIKSYWLLEGWLILKL